MAVRKPMSRAARKVLCLWCLLVWWPVAANARSTSPRDMPISCAAPKPPAQTDLMRPRGDANMWTFRIVPASDVKFVEGPFWSYPGQGGADPDWGDWSGGEDGDFSLDWSSPALSSAFSIRVWGKIGCGDGPGEPIDFEASWAGEVAFNAEMKVRRKNTGTYGSSAIVATGALSPVEHLADVEITATDNDGQPIEGVEIAAPEIENGDGEWPEADAAISPESAVTDAQGKALFTYYSSNIKREVTLKFYADDEAEPVTATVDQHWTDLPENATWELDPYFAYEEPSSITFNMALEGGVPITGHDVELETKKLSGFEWDPNAGEDWDEDGYPDGDYVEATYEGDEIDASGYGGLVEYGQTSEDPAGSYNAEQVVHEDEDFYVDSIEFDAVDWDAYAAE